MMISDLFGMLPPEGIKILVVLFLAFLLGLEREERKATGSEYAFGGVRTFPLIGLIGYATAFLAGDQLLAVAIGLVVVAAFLVLSYLHKLQTSPGVAGITSEMSALMTYLVGALVAHDQFWIATTLSVAGLLLLELKVALEGLTRHIESDEILTFTKFLLLTVVIVPVLPDQPFGPMALNPFKIWLVVVAVSAVSYGSYVIQRVTKGRGGVRVAAVLGGAYSSTVTTLVLARRAKREGPPHLLSGAILMASGTMYFRLFVLVGLFNVELLAILAGPLVVLGALGFGAGWLWTRRPDGHAGNPSRELEVRNPLEFRAALLFGALFVGMVTVTHLVIGYFGQRGLYMLAAVMGVGDVDPFIMGMTQTAGGLTPVGSAASAILLAASSNNLIKGIYAFAAADRKTGVASLILLVALALAGLAPLAWVGH